MEDIYEGDVTFDHRGVATPAHVRLVRDDAGGWRGLLTFPDGRDPDGFYRQLDAGQHLVLLLGDGKTSAEVAVGGINIAREIRFVGIGPEPSAP